jgi:hypothetical protein
MDELGPLHLFLDGLQLAALGHIRSSDPIEHPAHVAPSDRSEVDQTGNQIAS